jgi:hypothetical protein
MCVCVSVCAGVCVSMCVCVCAYVCVYVYEYENVSMCVRHRVCEGVGRAKGGVLDVLLRAQIG